MAHLRAALRQFADEREWDQFHSPKNLAIALTVEPPNCSNISNGSKTARLTNWDALKVIGRRSVRPVTANPTLSA